MWRRKNFLIIFLSIAASSGCGDTSTKSAPTDGSKQPPVDHDSGQAPVDHDSGQAPTVPINPPPIGGEQHDYFNALAPSALYAYSLRDQAEIDRYSCAGSACPNSVVTYSPQTDDYHTPQDAARFEIRGQDHPERNGVAESDLANQVRLPVPISTTDDGQTYVLTWDFWMGPEFQTENLVDPASGKQQVGSYKAFHLWAHHDRSDGTKRSKFWRFGAEVGKSNINLPNVARLWNQVTQAEVGPDVVDVEPLSPFTPYSAQVSTWTRMWVVITQHPGSVDDKVSIWIADEEREPVKTLDNLTVEIPYDAFETNIGISGFTVHFDTSSRRTLGGGRIVGYVRNVLMLQTPDIEPLLVKPRT